MTRWVLHQDHETGATVDLKIVGSYRYLRHPQTRVLCTAYGLRRFEDPFDPSIVQLWRTWAGDPMPDDLADAMADPTVLIQAWSAQFERLANTEMYSRFVHEGADIEEHAAVARIERYQCTAARARAVALNGKLELTARCLGLEQQKDMEGNRLMLKLTKLGSNGELIGTEEEMERLGGYCVQDVRTEGSVGGVIRDLTPEEWHDYHVNEYVNDRGIPVDIDLAKAVQHYARDEAATIRKALSEVTCGAVQTPRQFDKLKAWVLPRVSDTVRDLLTTTDKKTGKVKVSLDKDARASILEDNDLSAGVSDDVLEVLSLVDDAGRASTSKFATIVARGEPDWRVYGSYILNGGGQTGRYCVDGGTLVDTAEGPRPICELGPGDLVRTHKDRYRPVVRLFYKGVDKMFRLTFDSRAQLICTTEHRVRTSNGWRHVRELSDFETLRLRDASSLHATSISDHDAAGCRVRDDIPHSVCGAATGAIQKTASEKTWRQPLSFEEGSSKPDVRNEAVERSDLARRVLSGVGRTDACVSAPSCHVQSARALEVAAVGGSSPHRRRQDEQCAGQSGAHHNTRSPSSPYATLEKVEALGDRGIWDIEVAEDHSYTAQGLIHHNSAQGFQAHNMVRDKLAKAEEVIAAIMAGKPVEEVILAAGPDEDGSPFNILTILSRLMRPTVVAEPGNILVWADWSAIEARGLPWLTLDPDADALLEKFSKNEDVYLDDAAGIYGVPASQITKKDPRRQVGKVSRLSLGFLGGAGALRKMARNYKVKLDEQMAEWIKRAWRANNPWAERFGNALHTAAVNAVLHPGTVFEAGRIAYLMDFSTLWALLPGGRIICYPEARVDVVDGQWGPERRLSAIKGSWRPKGNAPWPRITLWRGLLVENADQGTCASILRAANRTLHDADWPLVMHTHDEPLLEVRLDEEAEAKEAIRAACMQRLPWLEGFPLDVEVSSGVVYGK